MDESSILLKVSEYVTAMLEKQLPAGMYFHNLSHTLDVVNAVQEIGRKDSSLSLAELSVLQIAAWFHDCGYCFTYQNHEEESIKIAGEFLKSLSYPEEKIQQIYACIAATKFPQMPVASIEQILCDADLYHLSCIDYERHEYALRREWEIRLHKFYSNEEWAVMNCETLDSHKYFTAYGKEILQKAKEENIKKLRCKYEGED